MHLKTSSSFQGAGAALSRKKIVFLGLSCTHLPSNHSSFEFMTFSLRQRTVVPIGSGTFSMQIACSATGVRDLRVTMGRGVGGTSVSKGGAYILPG